MNFFSLLLFTLNLSYALVEGQTCLDVYPKESEESITLGQNKLHNSDQPLFWLNFTYYNEGVGLPASETYRVHLSSSDPLKEIQKIKIIVLRDPYCGIGELNAYVGDFQNLNDPKCPPLYETTSRENFKELPRLLWTPPSCGCVKFRSIVMDERGHYYAEEKLANNKPLSRSICIKGTRSRPDYLTALCSVVKRQNFNAMNIIYSPFFQSRNRLNRMISSYSLSEKLKARRDKILDCCLKEETGYNEFCMDIMREDRINYFCNNKQPDDIPFVHFKVNYLNERAKKCCPYFGDKRYTCFAKVRKISMIPEASFLDFSLDDTDPANDVAIFASPQDGEELEKLRSVQFGKKTTITDNTNKPIVAALQKDTLKELEILTMKIKCCRLGVRYGARKTTLSTLKAVEQCQDEAGQHVHSSNNTSDSMRTDCENCFTTCCIERALSPKLSSCQKHAQTAPCEYCSAN